MYVFCLFALLVIVLIDRTLHMIAIREMDQRRSFFANAMFAFVIPSLVLNLVFSSRKK